MCRGYWSLGRRVAVFVGKPAGACFDPGAELGRQLVEVVHEACVEGFGALLRRHQLELLCRDDLRSLGHDQKLTAALAADRPAYSAPSICAASAADHLSQNGSSVGRYFCLVLAALSSARFGAVQHAAYLASDPK